MSCRAKQFLRSNYGRYRDKTDRYAIVKLHIGQERLAETVPVAIPRHLIDLYFPSRLFFLYNRRRLNRFTNLYCLYLHGTPRVQKRVSRLTYSSGVLFFFNNFDTST